MVDDNSVFNSFNAKWQDVSISWNRRSQGTHIIMASALLGLLTYNLFDFSAYGFQHSVLLTILVIAPSIMLHELMHVWAAKEMGYQQSRYIAYLPFLLLSCLVVLIFKAPLILLPGFASVAIPGRETRSYPLEWYHNWMPISLRIRNRGEMWAFIGLAGPIANFIMALVSLPFVILAPMGLFKMIFSLFLVVNFNLMLFNMLPIPIFDGSKVFAGNRKWFFTAWIIMILCLFIGLMILGGLGTRLII